MVSKKCSPQEMARLILICLQGKANEFQQSVLKDWLSECKENQAFYERLKSRAYFETGIQEYLKYNSCDDWQNIKLKIIGKRKRMIRRLLPYAAIGILMVGIAVSVVYKKSLPEFQQVAVQQAIEPGTFKAQLILADGKTIHLDVKGDSLQQRVEGENFVDNGKRLTYARQELHGMVQMHTLRIPRGGEYQLVLADGTRVWLNAETELHYPDRFPDHMRKVVLTGEAYFEVAKDTTKPFYVVMGDMEVSVLGTSFNVCAYPGERRQTTLVTGRVVVDYKEQHFAIRPGEQVSETPEGLSVTKVNVTNYADRRGQRFIYEDRLLEEVLNDLQRWYDVEVFVVNDQVRKLHLTANLPKYEDITKVLEIIEYAACVKCELKGRTVVVRAD